MNTSPRSPLFTRDFTLVVIGQIISLFGNAIIRFALPLYLLNQTGSPSLFGLVGACSFIPLVVLSPIGGIFADRVSKRAIMVVLDFSTAGIVLLFSLLLGKAPLVLLLIVTLMLLYGIQGAYQPAVQASLPVLTAPDRLISANAVINQVSSLAGLVGPAAGGLIYSVFGLYPILAVGGVCFLLSAIMELFIHIPFERRPTDKSALKIIAGDLSDSMRFIRFERPALGALMGVLVSINLFLSALIIVGVPVLVTQSLALPESAAQRLYGYAQAILAAGGLCGGILAGVMGAKLKIEKCGILFLLVAALLVPMGLSLAAAAPAMVSYGVIVACCFMIMTLASLMSVRFMALIQAVTPGHMIGKVISCVLALATCAQPVGQLLYGWLFEWSRPHWILFGAAAVTCCIAVLSSGSFGRLAQAETPPAALDGRV